MITAAESIETRLIIARECRQLVLSQGIAGALATLGVATLFLLALRDVHPREQLIGWAIAVLAVSVLRILLAVWSKRSSLEVGRAQPNTPEMCVLVGLLSGAVWGTAATLLFPLGHSELYFVTAFLLIGMPAGAISSFGAWWPAYAAYVVASVGPFALYFLVGGHREFMIAGIAACLFGVFLLREGFVIGRTIHRNIAQRIALLAMTESLGDALDRADAANRAKSTFLANMSHELRTPLNAIIGFSDVMRNEMLGPLPQRYVEYATDIHRSGQHLLHLIDEVLNMARIDSGGMKLDLETVDMGTLITDCVKSFEGKAKDANITFRTELRPMPVIKADKRAIREVVSNLLSNALKYNSRDGFVTIETRMLGDAVSVWIHDTGVGIAPANLPRVIKPFERLESATNANKRGGTGLGLAVSNALIEMHGGKLVIESEVDVGTSVYFTLPVAEA